MFLKFPVHFCTLRNSCFICAEISAQVANCTVEIIKGEDFVCDLRQHYDETEIEENMRAFVLNTSFKVRYST